MFASRRQQRGRDASIQRFSLNLLLIDLISSQPIVGQIKTQTPDDVVRTKTELVQTDVTMVDKRGRFVDGLTADDFELRVDSKIQSISSFEQVSAGSSDEEKQLSAPAKEMQLKQSWSNYQLRSAIVSV